MEDFNRIPRSGTFSDVSNTIDANFVLVHEALERLEYSREGFCGMYASATALNTAYPHPTTGSFAYVGSDFPMDVYKESGGSWVLFIEDGYDGGGIDLTQYATSSSVSSLSSTLTALLDAGFIYAGVATPSGTPVTNDGIRKFYFAWTAGTYTNYGSAVVASGELAVLTWNGATTWNSTKMDIVAKGIVGGYDEDVIEDSEKPATGGAVYNALSSLQEAFERDIYNEIDISHLDDLDLVTLGYIRYAGTLSRFIVTSGSPGNAYKVGTLDVFSDKDGNVVTQVFTTHYVFIGGSIDTSEITDDYLHQYYRSKRIVGASQSESWTSWKPVNDLVLDALHTTITSETTSAISTALSTALNYTETIITNIVDL